MKGYKKLPAVTIATLLGMLLIMGLVNLPSTIVNAQEEDAITVLDETGEYFPGASFTNDYLKDGDFLYIANGFDGLTIVNVTDPFNIAEVSSSATGYSAHQLVKLGDLVFVKNGDVIYTQYTGGGITVFNVSDVSNPQLVAEDHAITGTAIALYQNYIVLGTFSGTVEIYTFDNNALSLTSSIPGSEIVEHLTVVDNLLYTSRYTGAGDVYDLSDITNPSLVDSFTHELSIVKQVSPSVVYTWSINDYDTELFIYNNSNPASHNLLSNDTSIGVVLSASQENDTLHITERETVYYTYNVSNPTSPVKSLDQTIEKGFIIVEAEIGYAISGSDLNSGSGSLVTTYSVDPSLTLLDQINFERTKMRSIVSYENYFISYSTTNLVVLDLTGKIVHTITPADLGVSSSSIVDVYVVNSTLFYKIFGGLHAVNITNIFAPQYLDYIGFSGLEGGFAHRDNTLFYANNYGLYAFNISNPSNLSQLSYLDLSLISENGVYVFHDQLIVGDTYDQAAVVNATDVTNMNELGLISYRVDDVEVVDNRAILTTQSGLEIIEYRSNQLPQSLGIVNTGFVVQQIVSYNDKFVTGGNGGIYMFSYDIANLAGTIDLNYEVPIIGINEVTGLAVNGDAIALTKGFDGARFYEVNQIILRTTTVTETTTEFGTTTNVETSTTTFENIIERTTTVSLDGSEAPSLPISIVPLMLAFVLLIFSTRTYRKLKNQ